MPHTELHLTVHLENGCFWATADEYPGVFATGDTLAELRESLEEGISLYLAEPGQEPPPVELGELHPQPVATSAGAELTLA